VLYPGTTSALEMSVVETSPVPIFLRFTGKVPTFRLTGFFFSLHPVHPVIPSKKKLTARNPLNASAMNCWAILEHPYGIKSKSLGEQERPLAQKFLKKRFSFDTSEKIAVNSEASRLG